MPSAIATLTDVYHRRDPPRSLPVVGLTSNTVPWELVRAAGAQPFLISPEKTATPLGDRYMEEVFTPRIRAAFDFLLSPDAAMLSGVVIPRTSEEEHKLYLYLREAARQGVEHPPPAVLYNLLHTRSGDAQAYGLERTRELKVQLERLTGHAMKPDDLKSAIEEGNAARQALRALVQMREGARPRLFGSEALAVIGAWYFTNRTEYAKLAREALREIETRAPLRGPRILIQGASQDNLDFCAAVEASGAIVVAEDDWWGSRAAGRDIDVVSEPVEAIFEKYYFDAPGPRVFPAAVRDEWFCRKATEVDGVIFYLPAGDDVLGWDYPRQRAFLDQRAVPHLMVRDSCADPIHLFLEGLGRG